MSIASPSHTTQTPIYTISKCLNELIINDNISAAFEKITEWLPQSLQVDRSYIFKNTINQQTKQLHTSIIHWWEEGVVDKRAKDISYLKNINTTLFPEFAQFQHSGKPYSVAVNQNISAALQQMMIATDLQSWLLVPIISAGEFWGFMGLGTKHEIKIWEDEVVEMLQSLASAIGADIESRKLKGLLYQQAEVYETTLSLLNELMWEIDLRSKKGKVIGFNSKLLKNNKSEFNYNEDAWFARVHPEDVDKVKEKFYSFLLQPHKSSDDEVYRVLSADEDEYLWIQVRRTIIKDLDNEPAILIGSIVDITETRKVAFELEKHKEQYEFLVQNLSQVIFTIDTDGCWSFLSDAWLQISGYNKNESLGKPFTIYVADKEIPKQKVNFEKLMIGTVDMLQEQMLMKHKNGGQTWVKVLAKSIKDAAGKVVGVFGSLENIQNKYSEELVLQESNDRLNTILNSSKEIILTIDLESGQIQNVNEAITILGYTPKEWIGQYYTQWTLDKRRRFYELLKHASESSTEIRSQIISFANKENTDVIPFEFSTSLFNFKGRRYLLCVLRDIRERLEYEENIDRISEQLSVLMNNIDDVYAIYSLKDNVYEFVSDNVEGFFGSNKNIFMEQGLVWKDIIHIEDAPSTLQQIEEIITQKTKGEFFYRITTPVGETKMLLEKMTVSTDADGKADKVFIVITDYTTIETAERAMIENERRFRFISENISDLVSIHDTDGYFTYASPSSKTVLGYKPEDLVGKGSFELVHPEDVTKYIEDLLEKTVFDKQEAIVRYRLKAAKGDYRWVETHAKPIADARGATTSIVCSTRDVSEREQLMKDLEQALAKEKELNELRARFVSMASHQFRTPLTVIQSGVDIMDMYVDNLNDDKQKQFRKQFSKIHSEIVRLQDLMNDVLLLGRADAERTPFNPEKGDLVALIKEVIEKYNNRYPDDRKVLLKIIGKPTKVLYDAKLIDHSIENIISNAYKYSTTGNVEIEVEFKPSTVQISITDHGIGIPQEDLGNLFHAFYRAGNTSEIEGTGLGLSIVNEFINKHGGEILVMSQLNKGTTFCVILPVN
jgi:PAS domain S-box-containing protein